MDIEFEDQSRKHYEVAWTGPKRLLVWDWRGYRYVLNRNDVSDYSYGVFNGLFLTRDFGGITPSCGTGFPKTTAVPFVKEVTKMANGLWLAGCDGSF